MQKRKSGFCKDVNAAFLLVADVGFKFLLESSKTPVHIKAAHYILNSCPTSLSFCHI
jgi:hypothetical protein